MVRRKILVGEWLKAAQQQLAAVGIESARLDALILLEDELKRDRAWLLAHPEHELSRQRYAKLKKLLKRRAAHEPLAYIRGHVEFYGYNFVVNKHVLTPRPESEAFVELLQKIYTDFKPQKGIFSAKYGSKGQARNPLKIADIGTGCGALGITAKLTAPKGLKAHFTLVDISKKALKTAKINVDLLTTGVDTKVSDLIAGLQENQDILLCNLPYVPDGYSVNKAAQHEPRLALYSGKDGLTHYRKLFKQLQNRPTKPLYLLLESLKPQHTELAQIAAKNGYKLAKTSGLVQLYKLAIK